MEPSELQSLSDADIETRYVVLTDAASQAASRGRRDEGNELDIEGQEDGGQD